MNTHRVLRARTIVVRLIEEWKCNPVRVDLLAPVCVLCVRRFSLPTCRAVRKIPLLSDVSYHLHVKRISGLVVSGIVQMFDVHDMTERQGHMPSR